MSAVDVRSKPAGPALESYRQWVATVAPGIQDHGTWLVAAVGGRQARVAGQPAEVLARELRLLVGQLRSAGLDPGPPLGLGGLRSLIWDSYRIQSVSRRRRRAARPLATREEWSQLLTEDAWHVTYWVAEWPRIEVGPEFFGPLLMGTGRRRVSLTMAPIAIDRAMRDVRSARTADLADEELRSRAGFLPSARRGREAEGVARREVELADGHIEYRYSGYVTVSAPDRDSLTAACAETEHAAQSARLELLRLYGRQAEAFTWTLPLARGLR
jgi:hypothetical protein